jgi:hypothetical protein
VRVGPGLLDQHEEGGSRESDADLVVRPGFVRDAEGVGQGGDAIGSIELQANHAEAAG